MSCRAQATPDLAPDLDRDVLVPLAIVATRLGSREFMSRDAQSELSVAVWRASDVISRLFAVKEKR